jgi:hypothetical protein
MLRRVVLADETLAIHGIEQRSTRTDHHGAQRRESG